IQKATALQEASRSIAQSKLIGGQSAIDSIRQEFGFTTIQKATALQEASRSIAQSKLIGGQSAGGLDGLK
ncbi:hypothetical protein, partial [Streptococcus thermophilus]